MATTQRNLSIHDIARSEPPVPVRAATAAWFLAVGAGVAESVLGAVDLNANFVAFAVIRSVHVMPVITGVVLMHQPEANRWFVARRTN